MTTPVNPFENLGLACPDLMLPRVGTDLRKWAVVACDQYTSQPEYWEEVSALVGTEPSTLHLILPEVYLETDDVSERYVRIHRAMQSYLNEDILVPVTRSFVYVERTLTGGMCRRGLVVAMDLECYDYRAGSKTLTRATEKTVEERLPPRIRIREGAALESPHVMVLIDDPERTVIEPLSSRKGELEQLYDVELMKDGGHLRGYRVADPVLLEGIRSGLAGLADPERMTERYQAADSGALLYAMGDGNHSLAAAKGWWEQCKAAGAGMDHPARHALVELVNVHDEALTFEPIHRVVFQVDFNALTGAWRTYAAGRGTAMEMTALPSLDAVKNRVRAGSVAAQTIGYVHASGQGVISLSSPYHNIEVGSLQVFLDDFLRNHPDSRIDYIHGDQVVADLAGQDGNLGFLLPVLGKSGLFKTVLLDGALPRKSFSMGEAQEKRYYMECRRIR